jgi:hypothetical protein
MLLLTITIAGLAVLYGLAWHDEAGHVTPQAHPRKDVRHE